MTGLQAERRRREERGVSMRSTAVGLGNVRVWEVILPSGIGSLVGAVVVCGLH